MNIARTFLIYFFSVYVVLLCCNIIFPPQSDDFVAYYSAITNSNFFHSYFSWNGRFGEIFYTGFLASITDKLWFDLLNALVGSVFVFAFFFLLFLRFPKDKLDFFLFAALCVMLINSNFAAIFLWGSGSLNYLWGIGLIVLFLVPYRLFWDNYLNQRIDKKQKTWEFIAQVLVVPFGVLAGWSSEHIGITTCFFLFLSIVYAVYKKIRLPWWYYVGFLFFTIGWIILFLSPGSTRRSEIFLESNAFIPLGKLLHMSLVEQIKLVNQVFSQYCYRGFAIFSFFFMFFYCWKKQYSLKKIVLVLIILPVVWIFAKHVSGLVVCLIGIFFMYDLVKQDRKYLFLLFLYIAWIFIGATLLQLRGSIPWRAHFGDGLLLAAMILIILKDFYINIPSMQGRLMCGVNIVLFVSTIACMANWGYVRWNWEEAVDIVERQKIEGQEHVIVPEKLFCSFFRKDWEGPHVNETTWWVNQVYARYFGVKTFDLK